LILFAGFCMAASILLAVTSIVALHTVNKNTAELEQKGLVGANLLGDLDYNISAFRLDENYRVMMSDPGSIAFADALTAARARHIAQLETQYANLLGNDLPEPDFSDFMASWHAYKAAHDAWLAADPDGRDLNSATYGSRLDEFYQSTDTKIDRLVDLQRIAGEARAADVDRIRRETLVICLAICLLALICAVWVMVRISGDLIRPLQNITHTLTDLAAGQHEIQIPERHRLDEIGAMAAACEAFRVNVLALDRAHAETRAAKEEANQLARHDALTGLPNRRVFSANLETALRRAQNGAATYSVLLLDLDEFKKINDLQGHHVGDTVLCEVARRLEKATRKTDTVARLGGDEFAIIIDGEADYQRHIDGAKRLANRLLTTVRQPIASGDNKINIGVSIGIAVCREDATDSATLLRAADIAMYRSKQNGRSTFRFFEQSMDDEMREREALEHDIIQAIAKEQINPYFQPLIDITSNRIRGFEALARWQHPEHGFVPPDVFVPIVEHLGLMNDLTVLILRQSCREARQWPEEIRIAVNVSPTEFKDPKLADRILAILAEEGLAPSRLEVEVTETAFVTDIKAARVILTQLQDAGISICLDDFGTGYSSLCHLHELNFDKVKIDRSFVQSMQNNSGSEKIIDAILSLTKSLGLATVAEGIENAELCPLLVQKGCTYGQGYYFGKAMRGVEAQALIKTGLAPRRLEPALS